MLSSLSSEASLPQEQFQAIMRHLLSFIAKEKQVDSLVEKLCLRFSATQVKPWSVHNVSNAQQGFVLTFQTSDPQQDTAFIADSITAEHQHIHHLALL